MLLSALNFIRSLLVTIPLIALGTLFMGAIAVAGSLLKTSERLRRSWMKLWARLVLRVSFVRVSASGLDGLERDRAYVFCANHLSYMDPPILLACLRHPAVFIAKASLFRIPFFGAGMRATGNIAIDRANARSAKQSLQRAAEALRSGVSIVIFPEGGRSDNGQLQPFHSGAFRLAIELGAPVVPLAITGSREILRPGTINVHAGRVSVYAAQPMETTQLTLNDRHMLAHEVREIVAAMLRAGNVECPGKIRPTITQ
jgi:1-acyl-sn-glycerol-3-phosphate acyltransferase